jgi:hypothetical protein
MAVNVIEAVVVAVVVVMAATVVVYMQLLGTLFGELSSPLSFLKMVVSSKAWEQMS